MVSASYEFNVLLQLQLLPSFLPSTLLFDAVMLSSDVLLIFCSRLIESWNYETAFILIWLYLSFKLELKMKASKSVQAFTSLQTVCVLW